MNCFRELPTVSDETKLLKTAKKNFFNEAKKTHFSNVLSKFMKLSNKKLHVIMGKGSEKTNHINENDKKDTERSTDFSGH